MKILDFQRHTVHSEYQEQPYQLKKKNAVMIFDPHKKVHVTFVGYSWNIQGIFLYIQYSWNIVWEYSLEFHSKLFPSIPGMYHGNAP